MYKEIFYKNLNRIEFWIIFFFLIRMVGITNPPIEVAHNWRQATGLMVARNFVETDANILFPRVDDNMGGTGIIGMEFPAMNYLYFLIAEIFGYTHWYGRLINLIISSIGLFFFYKIVNKYFGHRHALFAALCLIGSLWFSFSRKMMPDTFCISLMFIGIYYGMEYLDKGLKRNIFLYLFFVSLAILSKIPAGIYLAVFFPLFFYYRNTAHKVVLGLSTLIPLGLTYCWYFVWNPYLSVKYGFWYNSGKELSVGFHEIISNPGLVSAKFYFSAFNSFVFFALFITGLLLMLYKRKSGLIFSFIAVSVVFVIYMFKSGFYFYHHNYYIIPFVPVMALIAGYAISLTEKKWVFVTLLSLGIVESIANQQHDFFNKESEKYRLELEAIADSVTSPRDLIVINGNGNPQQMYLAHRKGWTCNDEQLADSRYIMDIASKGSRFIFVNKNTFRGSTGGKKVFENRDYAVYRVDEPALVH